MPERSVSHPIVAERRRAARDTTADHPPAGPIGTFVATDRGCLSRFDAVFAGLLALHTRPYPRRRLTLGWLMGASATRAIDEARRGAFAHADCSLPDGRTLLLRTRRGIDGTRGWVEDVSAIRRTETRLRFAALHDPLTGLMNRRGLQRPLADIIAGSNARPASVVFIDLDGFKQINDVFGHAAGDSVLRQFATRLRQLLQPGDCAARVGGDEFVVALIGPMARDCDAWIQGLQRSLDAAPFRHFSHEFAIEFSAGCIGLDPTISPDAAIDAADHDCARVKSGELAPGKLMEPSLLSVLSRLHRQAGCPGLELLAQGVHASGAGLPRIGVEWLLRLRDDRGRQRRPSEFLPAARQLGLATQIDLWVMRCALDWLSRAKATPFFSKQPFLVMKLSAESLYDRRFQRQAIRLLRARPSAAEALRIEVSARHIGRGSGAAAELLSSVRELGTRTVLGGLSQLPVWMPEVLRLRPIAIKLDIALADERGEQPASHRSVQMLLDHCRALGIEACASRIESNQTLEWARRIGFHQVQGFLLGKPGRIDEATPQATASQPVRAS